MEWDPSFHFVFPNKSTSNSITKLKIFYFKYLIKSPTGQWVLQNTLSPSILIVCSYWKKSKDIKVIYKELSNLYKIGWPSFSQELHRRWTSNQLLRFQMIDLSYFFLQRHRQAHLSLCLTVKLPTYKSRYSYY